MLNYQAQAAVHGTDYFPQFEKALKDFTDGE